MPDFFLKCYDTDVHRHFVPFFIKPWAVVIGISPIVWVARTPYAPLATPYQSTTLLHINKNIFLFLITAVWINEFFFILYGGTIL